jgi:hypothetical protein
MMRSSAAESARQSRSLAVNPDLKVHGRSGLVGVWSNVACRSQRSQPPGSQETNGYRTWGGSGLAKPLTELDG